MLIDTHAHLDFPEFEADREAVLARARESGVGHIIAVGFDMRSSQAVVDLAERHADLSAAVGVHPSDASTWNRAVAEELERLGRHPKVVAIGETGLDFYRNGSPRTIQRIAFQEQLELAAKLGLPVVVHDRDAHGEVMAALRAWASSAEVAGNPSYDRGLGVLHCFSGDLAMAEQLVAMGFLISFAGPITYPKSTRLAELARKLPLNSIVVETDSPYLAPQPWRGRRNEPAYVTAVAEKVAALRSAPVAAVAEATTANARRAFGLP